MILKKGYSGVNTYNESSKSDDKRCKYKIIDAVKMFKLSVIGLSRVFENTDLGSVSIDAEQGGTESKRSIELLIL